jgi:hypothetical protein
MCTVLLPPGVNPIAVHKYIISGAWLLKKRQTSYTCHRVTRTQYVSKPATVYFEPLVSFSWYVNLIFRYNKTVF